MTRVTTHVLDTARGRPAAGVAVLLERAARDGWRTLAREQTDADGRVTAFPAVASGRHRIIFDTAAHLGDGAFFPEVAVAFDVTVEDDHCHVPLLLSPFGYSTYRGS